MSTNNECSWILPETEQEVFNTAVAGLLRQGRRSTGRNLHSGCRYRGAEGCKCAAGFLIPDEHYEPTFEGISWRSLVSIGKAPKQHLHLILRLQHIHDWMEPHEWREAFIEIAYRLRLDDSIFYDIEQEQKQQ